MSDPIIWRIAELVEVAGGRLLGSVDSSYEYSNFTFPLSVVVAGPIRRVEIFLLVIAEGLYKLSLTTSYDIRLGARDPVVAPGQDHRMHLMLGHIDT